MAGTGSHDHHAQRPAQNHENPGYLRVSRVVFWVVGVLALAVTAYFEFVISVFAAMAFDSCDSTARPAACGVTAQWAATLTPMIGSVVGLIVALVMPWIFKPRPRLLWILAGFGVQLLTFITMLVIVGNASPSSL